MSQDFLVTITNSDRAAEWQAVFDTTTIPVKSPIPQWVNLTGRGESLVFFLDLDLITTEQRQRMIEYISQKFDLDLDEVENEINEHGVPILDEDCSVIVHHPLKWFT